MNYAPIVYFAYNRPHHMRQTLEAIRQADLSDLTHLIIYCDGAKPEATAETLEQVAEVRRIAHENAWAGEVTVVERTENIGLLQSISTGVTEVVNEYGRVIVIEDDVLISKSFLVYMNKALDLYAKDKEVMHVSGFSPIQQFDNEIAETSYFYNHTYCWGWATWKRAWDHFSTDAFSLMGQIKKEGRTTYINLDNTAEIYWGLKHIQDGRFQSWNYFWHTCVNLNNGLCLHPKWSLIKNIGFDGSGTNCTTEEDGRFNTQIDSLDIRRLPLKENKKVRQLMTRQPLIREIKFVIRHYLKYLQP